MKPVTEIKKAQIKLDELEASDPGQFWLNPPRTGAVVLDRYGHAWQYGGWGYWYRAYDSNVTLQTSREVSRLSPITVIYEGSAS